MGALFKLTRRHSGHLLSPLVIAGTVFAVGCTSTSPRQKMSENEARRLVSQLPQSVEKRISLALINNPATTYRIDEHGYPAWRWRGEDDIGACVHIDPKTRKPYLENQFSKSQRTSTPKYIDFGTDGEEWMCRIHRFTLGVEYEKNWSSEQCHREGKELVIQVSRALIRG